MNTFSFVKNSANDQTPEETWLVGAYELGALIRAHYYWKRYGRGYRDECRVAVADLISMIRMFCEQRQMSYSVMEPAHEVSTLEETLIELYKLYCQPYVSHTLGMIGVFCSKMGWNYEELQILGEQRYLERMQDLRLHGLQEKVIVRDEK